MSRTTINIPLNNQDPNQVHERIKAILTADGYREQTYKKNEIVWRKGLGLLTAMHFIKLDYQPNMLVVSGWVPLFGIFGVSFGEDQLSGVSAVIPKQSTQKTIDKIVASVAGQPIV